MTPDNTFRTLLRSTVVILALTAAQFVVVAVLLLDGSSLSMVLTQLGGAFLSAFMASNALSLVRRQSSDQGAEPKWFAPIADLASLRLSILLGAITVLLWAYPAATAWVERGGELRTWLRVLPCAAVAVATVMTWKANRGTPPAAPRGQTVQ